MNNMPSSSTSSSRLDRAIDRAVRDMVQIDPRPGFRRRVLARLDPEPVRSSPSFLWRFVAAGGALAMVALIAMFAGRDRRSELPTRAVQHEAAAAQPAAPSTAPKPQLNADASRPQVQPPVRAPRGRSRLTSEPIQMPHVGNVFGNRSAAAGAASVDADALWPSAVPKIPQEQDEGLAPLMVAPLEPPAPIVIPPLTPRGPGLNE